MSVPSAQTTLMVLVVCFLQSVSSVWIEIRFAWAGIDMSEYDEYDQTSDAYWERRYNLRQESSDDTPVWFHKYAWA